MPGLAQHENCEGGGYSRALALRGGHMYISGRCVFHKNGNFVKRLDVPNKRFDGKSKID